MKQVNVWTNNTAFCYSKQVQKEFFNEDPEFIRFSCGQRVAIMRNGKMWVVIDAMDKKGNNNFHLFDKGYVEILNLCK